MNNEFYILVKIKSLFLTQSLLGPCLQSSQDKVTLFATRLLLNTFTYGRAFYLIAF